MRPNPEAVQNDPSSVELALVDHAKAGSGPAFSALVQRHQQAVRAFARRVCGELIDADDIAQEAFVTAWSRLGHMQGQSSFRAWVCGIVYRKALTARRGVLRELSRDGAYAQSRGWAVGEPVEPAAKTKLNRAMAALPVDQRAVVALCLAGDFSHAEAAEVLNLPLGTVKSHVNRGRVRLLELLGGRDERAA